MVYSSKESSSDMPLPGLFKAALENYFVVGGFTLYIEGDFAGVPFALRECCGSDVAAADARGAERPAGAYEGKPVALHSGVHSQIEPAGIYRDIVDVRIAQIAFGGKPEGLHSVLRIGGVHRYVEICPVVAELPRPFACGRVFKFNYAVHSVVYFPGQSSGREPSYRARQILLASGASFEAASHTVFPMSITPPTVKFAMDVPSLSVLPLEEILTFPFMFTEAAVLLPSQSMRKTSKHFPFWS